MSIAVFKRIPLAVTLALALGCGSAAPGDSYDPLIDPSRFVSKIDNPFLPLTPATTRIYREVRMDGSVERVEVTVTRETKSIMGVTCVVVHDQAFVDDVLEEDTYDWFAQDQDGAVWYFGEATTAADDEGQLTDTEGSWEAGVDGGKPGIVMLAHPSVGDSYREEYLEDSAEDQADVVSVNESVHVPFGAFDDCIETKNYTRLDPAIETKFYCAGIGEVLVLEDGARGELISLADSYEPMIDPSRFVAQIDNPFLPLTPGTSRTYREVRMDGSVERVELSVTHETKSILGVDCVVVRDQAFVDDVLEEDTYDWFAQDQDGTVWYFGEATRAADAQGELTDTEGSWEAGVNGGRAGVVMPAHPQIGDSYREEFLAGSAEDQADVISIGESVEVPYGSFTDCVETKNYTRLDPAIENKFYCAGVGEVLVLEEGVRGELITLTSE